MLIVSYIVSTYFKWTLWFLRFVCFGRGSWADAYLSSYGMKDTVLLSFDRGGETMEIAMQGGPLGVTIYTYEPKGFSAKGSSASMAESGLY